MTYKALYNLGVEKLSEACIEEAALDARLLLEEVCGTDRGYLLVHGDNEVCEEQYNCYVNYIEQRAKHIPLQSVGHHRDNLFQIEAIFMGQAGLLSLDTIPQKYQEEATNDGYFPKLKHLHK